MDNNLLKDKIINFIRERDWEQFHTPKNLAIAIGAEAGELLECFQWKTDENIKQLIEDKNIENISDEIADIYIYLVSLCSSLNVDFEKAVQNKLEKSKQKYPIEKCLGSSKKYTEF